MAHIANGTNKTGWKFWLYWVTATTLGVAISTLFANALGLSSVPFPFEFITLAGTTVGIIQWKILRQIIPRNISWILINFVGSYVGGCTWFVTFAYWEFFSISLLSLISYLMYGIIISTVQWTILKPYIPRVSWWIFFNILGCFISFIMSVIVRFTFRYAELYPSIRDCAALLIINGFMQATILVWFLRRRY